MGVRSAELNTDLIKIMSKEAKGVQLEKTAPTMSPTNNMTKNYSLVLGKVQIFKY